MCQRPKCLYSNRRFHTQFCAVQFHSFRQEQRNVFCLVWQHRTLVQKLVVIRRFNTQFYIGTQQFWYRFGLCQALCPLGVNLFAQRINNVIFASKIFVQRRWGKARSSSHRPQRQSVEAIFVDQLLGCLQDHCGGPLTLLCLSLVHRFNPRQFVYTVYISPPTLKGTQ